MLMVICSKLMIKPSDADIAWGSAQQQQLAMLDTVLLAHLVKLQQQLLILIINDIINRF